MARLLATDTATGHSCELDILKEIFHKPPARPKPGPRSPATTPWD